MNAWRRYGVQFESPRDRDHAVEALKQNEFLRDVEPDPNKDCELNVSMDGDRYDLLGEVKRLNFWSELCSISIVPMERPTAEMALEKAGDMAKNNEYSAEAFETVQRFTSQPWLRRIMASLVDLARGEA